RLLVLLGPPRVQQRVPAGVLGVLDVLAGRAVAALAADVLQVRRVPLVAVARLVGEADRVADDALAVVLAQRRPGRLDQALVGVAVLGLPAHVVRRLLALLSPVPA